MTHLHPHRSDDDQIFQKYLDRAIADINDLAGAMAACDLCAHEPGFHPVVGTGHPLADVFLLKFRPRASELDEGVAFYGRAGEAILKGVRKLNVDPLDIYGTNCVKCSDHPTPCEAERCPSWLKSEIAIVEPKLVIVMGEQALDALNGLDLPDTRQVRALPGELQAWTHTCEALYCPDIDSSLDGVPAKQAFWSAFRTLGDWYAERPPW